MKSIIVIENVKRWPLALQGATVVAAKDYLIGDEWAGRRNVRVYNFCRTYGYQTVGYYVSLLAEARGHRPLPTVETLQDLRLSPVVRIVSEQMEELIQKSLAKLRGKRFELSVYFGRNLSKRYDALARALYEQFSVPLLRASFERGADEWRLSSVRPISTGEIPESHRPFVINQAEKHFGRRERSTPARKYQYDLAILYDPEAEDSPSDSRTLRKFSKAAREVGIRPHLIRRDDAEDIGEFDALFIRETTYVNGPTYRMARRAATDGLIVIDDPISILRCSNKVFLAELFSRHGIPHPKTFVAHEDSIDEIASEVGIPCVLKRPDSAFSRGVTKASSLEELREKAELFLADSELVVAQAFTASQFDWRIGVLGGEALFACRYHMARGHWQIVRTGPSGFRRYGKVDTLALEDVPPKLLEIAVRAASLIGDGLYGVDLKEVDGEFLVIEINDNPNVEVGYEDTVLGDEIYRRIMQWFRIRLDRRGGDDLSMSDETRAKPGHTLSLFEGFGIELEYMIVDAATLDVKPIADRLIEAESGSIENEIERGAFAWSNELARHVIEVKTNGPVPGFGGVADGFDGELRRMHERLAPMGARVLPTAMHPWMDAARDFELWPHGSHEIYDAFHRIFDCRGHGWANLQSAHLNLPFSSDDEFGRLHAAARALLPILPALAASSPCVDGRISGFMDTRLDVYRTNARRVPSVSGSVVPEPVFTHAAYQALLESIYADLAPLDPEGLLRSEWVNARGCIARFDRMAIEIRVLDVQETPRADVAIHAAITASLRALCQMGSATQARLRTLDTAALAEILRATTREAERTQIVDSAYLSALGFDAQPRCASDLWCELLERDFAHDPLYPSLQAPLDVIRDEGTLSTRILRRLRALASGRGSPSSTPTRETLREVYGELADCLRDGRMLRAPS